MRFRKYTVKQGDTIQLIAQNELGDLTRWPDLAQYNNLSYPYVLGQSESTNPRVLSAGDEMTIPLDSDLSAINVDGVNANDAKQIAGFALGVDLSLMTESDNFKQRGTTDELVSLSSNGKGLTTVSGYENLRQALLLRLNTQKGSLPLHPEYGIELSSIIGQKNSVATVNRLKVMVEQALRYDGRVGQVSVSAVKVSGEEVTLNATVTPIGFEEQLSLLVSMDKIGNFTLD